MESPKKSFDAHSGAKKPYSKPKLEIYGDIASITQTIAGSGKSDGSKHPNQKFTKP